MTDFELVSPRLSKSTLKELLVERIRSDGPISFSRWMAEALYNPVHGYYCRTDRQRWGREGDYRTSPERSTLFATTFAHYFHRLYKELGSPPCLHIFEYGPGDGSFAEVLLSTLRERFSQLYDVTRYMIEEISESTTLSLRDRLAKFSGHVEFNKLESLADVPSAIVFSNEFIDALPVHRLILKNGELFELFVSIDAREDFVWALGPLSESCLAEFLAAIKLEWQEGQIVEVSTGVTKWFKTLRDKLARCFIVTVDYGLDATALYDFARYPAGTLRGYARHDFVENLLLSPGDNDLTTNVDWSFVRRTGEANGFVVESFSSLDQFLINNGLLDVMAEHLQSVSTEAERSQLTTSAREMVLPHGIAANFQVLVQSRQVINKGEK